MLGRGAFRLGGLLTIGRLLQIGSALILIKLLTASQMGSVALLTAVFVGVYSLSNFGFSKYIIHAENNDLNQDVIDHIWTLQIIQGLASFSFCIIIALLVPIYSNFDSGIIPQLMFIGLALLIYAFANPSISLFERDENFTQIANCRGLSMFLGALVVAVSAYLLHSPWAYVLGQFISTLVYTGMTFYYCKDRPKISYNKEIFKNIFKYCKYIIIISIVSMIAVQFEVFYITFAFGANMLGLYFTWARLIYIPRELIAQICDKILFAKACASRREGESLVKDHLLVFSLVSLVVFPFYALIWFYGEWFIALLAGNEWVAYHWIGKFCIIISSLWLVALLLSPVVLANFPKLSSILRTIEVCVMIILMLWLGSIYGIKGVLIASLVGIFIAMLIRFFIVYKFVFREERLQHFAIITITIAIGLGGYSGYDFYYGFDNASSIPELSFILCSFFYIAFMGLVIFSVKNLFDPRVKTC